MLVAKGWTDKRIEDTVANLLRAGVVLSAVVAFCGAIVYLGRHGRSPADYRTFQGEPRDVRTVNGIVQGAMSMQGRAIIQLGLLLLIATPVVRVAFSVFGFAAERDHLYVVFTVVVLAILLFSLVLTVTNLSNDQILHLNAVNAMGWWFVLGLRESWRNTCITFNGHRHLLRQETSPRWAALPEPLFRYCRCAWQEVSGQCGQELWSVNSMEHALQKINRLKFSYCATSMFVQ